MAARSVPEAELLDVALDAFADTGYAGTSVRESVDLIRTASAIPAGVLIALDRMERSGSDETLSPESAVQAVESTYGMPVLAIANLNDLLRFLNSESSYAATARSFLPAVQRYRERYGAA